MKGGFRFGVAAAIGLLWAPVALAGTINVPADHATINAAIGAAVDGDVIRVAPGTYTEGVDFLGKAITLESTSGPASTTIVGAGNIVVKAQGASGFVLRGFTLRDGGSIGLTDHIGAIDARNTSGLVENNRVVDNQACSAAGIAASGTVVIQHNVFANNTMECTGGGLIAPVELEGDVVFANNLVTGNGMANGAVGVNGNASVTGNVIAGNRSFNGGGVYVFLGAPTIANNLITGNISGSSAGGGVLVDGAGATIVNNTIVGNAAPRGSAIGIEPGATPAVVRNNIMSGTSALIDCAAPIAPQPGPVFESNAFVPGVQVVTGTSSCADPTGTAGNVRVDPGFVAAAVRDFHLASTSPLLDGGTATGAPSTDIDGDARPLDGSAGPAGAQIDIGFDEAVEAGNTVTTAIDTAATESPDAATFTFSSPTAGASFECSFDMSVFAACTSPVTYSALRVHEHVFQVRAKDGLGNVDRSPAMRLFGGTGPDTKIDSPPVGVPGKAFWRTSFSSDQSGATFECSLDGAAFATCTSPYDMPVYLGIHTVSVRAKDAAGNVDATPATARWNAICTLFGTDVNETIRATAGNDGLCGNGGNDLMFGGPGEDLLFGGNGNDVLTGGAGADHLYGGPGTDDTANYSDHDTPVTVRLGTTQGAGNVTDGVGDAIDPFVEDILGGTAADRLTGDAGDNFIDGGPGGDRISGRGGFDFADYSFAKTPVSADIDAQVGDDGRIGEADTILPDIESIVGGAAGDSLRGNAKANILFGNDGNDRLTGGGGSDILVGGKGNDTLMAFDGKKDKLNCGAGVDVAYGDAFDLESGCERKHVGAPPAQPPGHALAITALKGSSTAGITVQMNCRSTRVTQCRVRFVARTTVRVGGKRRTVVIGQVGGRIYPNQPSQLHLALNAEGKALFTTRVSLKVTLVSRLAAPSGSLGNGPTKTMTLSRPPSRTASVEAPQDRNAQITSFAASREFLNQLP